MQKLNLCCGDEFRVSELATCRRPLTVLALVRYRASPCIFFFFAGQSGSGAFFFLFGVFRFSPVVIIPLVLHTRLHLHDTLTSFFP